MPLEVIYSTLDDRRGHILYRIGPLRSHQNLLHGIVFFHTRFHLNVAHLHFCGSCCCCWFVFFSHLFPSGITAHQKCEWFEAMFSDGGKILMIGDYKVEMWRGIFKCVLRWGNRF